MPEPFADRFDQALDGCFLGEINLKERCVPTTLTDFGEHPLALRRVAASDRHARTFRDEAMDDSSTDPRISARNERNLPRQPHRTLSCKTLSGQG
jgi:hypothetical protein